MKRPSTDDKNQREEMEVQEKLNKHRDSLLIPMNIAQTLHQDEEEVEDEKEEDEDGGVEEQKSSNSKSNSKSNSRTPSRPSSPRPSKNILSRNNSSNNSNSRRVSLKDFKYGKGESHTTFSSPPPSKNQNQNDSSFSNNNNRIIQSSFLIHLAKLHQIVGVTAFENKILSKAEHHISKCLEIRREHLGFC